MNSLFRHSLRLTIPNLLGYLLSNLVVGLGYVLFFLVVFIGAGISAGLNSLNEDLDALSLAQLPVLLIGALAFILCAYASNAVMLGGAFGTSISALYEGHASTNHYFDQAFRHLWKLTLLQLAWTVVILPVFLPFLLIVRAVESAGTVAATAGILLILMLSLLLFYLCGALYVYSPVLMIRERWGVWQSVKASLRLAFSKPGQSLATLLIVSGTFLGIILVFAAVFGILGLLTGISFDSGMNAAGAAGTILSFLAVIGFIFFVIPFAFAMMHLIIVKRYKERIEPDLFPGGHSSGQGTESEPVFDLKDAH